MNTLKPALVGFFQAVGIVLYVMLVATFMSSVENVFSDVPEVLAAITMLLLFVFSAAVTSSLFFGYSVLVVIQKQVRRALEIVAWTFGWLFVGVILVITLAATV